MRAQSQGDCRLGRAGVAQNAAQATRRGQNHQHIGDGFKGFAGQFAQALRAVDLPGLNVGAQCEQRREYGDQQGCLRAAHKAQNLVCDASRSGHGIGPTAQADERYRQQNGCGGSDGTGRRGGRFPIRFRRIVNLDARQRHRMRMNREISLKG